MRKKQNIRFKQKLKSSETFEEGSTNTGNTTNLEIEAMSLVGGSQYSGSFPCSMWDPQHIFSSLSEHKYIIEAHSSEKILLKINPFTFPLQKSKQENEIAFLKAKITFLEKRLEKSLENQKPIVICLSSGQQTHEKKMIWDKQNIPLDTKYFTLSENKKDITIHEEGIYRFDVKICSGNGSYFAPFLALNNSGIMYFYGSADQDSVLNLSWLIPKNGIISIGVQNGAENAYSSSVGNTNYICITKL